MRRFALVSLLLLSSSAFAQFPDMDKVQIKVTKVAGNVYMLEGAGGNIGVSVGEDGILIVDDQFAVLAPKIKAALKGISDKPLRWIINTHYHGDHTNGNLVFGAEAPIIAHENVRRRLAEGGVVFGEKKPAPKVALPVLTFGENLSVWVNGEEIKAIHLPPAHTDGDSIIHFTGSKVVHMGDDLVVGAFPYIDIEGGGTVKGLIANAEKMAEALPPDVKIIPGHGPLTNVQGLRDFAALLKAISAVIEDGIKQGKTADQLKKEKALAKWDKLGHGFVNPDTFIDMLYGDLSRSTKK